MLESLRDQPKDCYTSDFRVANAAIVNGRVATTFREEEAFGKGGASMSNPSESTLTLLERPIPLSGAQSPPLVDGYGRATTVEVIRSLMLGLRSQSGPLARPATWTLGETCCTGPPSDI